MNNNTQQQAPKSPMRYFWIALLCILIVGVAFWMFSNSGNGTKISLSPTFTNQLEAGKISKVEINSKTINITYKNGKKAWFYSRSSVETRVQDIVEAYNQTHSETPVQLVPGTTTTFSLINFLYIILVAGSTIFLVIWVTRSIKGANNKSFDFVKNRARIGESVVKFSDVAGADEEKQEVAEIVEFLKNPDKFREVGARVPKGVLLVGPPGTGKTLLAKAIAGEAGVPFFTISGSDFMELFVGVGASRVRDLFVQAKRLKPCIVFIDEIDAVGRQRGAGMGGGNDEREQTLNQLLVQMDGFEPNEGIIVLAATNRADILDPALMRPGRFDRQIHIHAPDVRGREEILKVHARNKKFTPDVDFGQIARITSGFTGADLENLLNEAAILAASDNRKQISPKDLSDGIDKVILGPQKKSWVMTERDKERTACHESGHAVVQHYVKNSEPIHEVSIIPRGAAAGYTLSRPSDDDMHVTQSKLFDQIMMLLGGRVAEQVFLKDVSTGASNDIQRATEIARNMVTKWGMSDRVGLVCLENENQLFLGRDYQSRAEYSEQQANIIDEEVRKIIDSAKQETEKIITKYKKQMQTLTNCLLEKETLYEDEINLVFANKSKDEIVEYINKKIEDKKPKTETKQKPQEPEVVVEKSTIKSEEPSKPNIEIIEENNSENNKNLEENSENKNENNNEKPNKDKEVRLVGQKESDDDIPDNIGDVVSKKKDKNK